MTAPTITTERLVLRGWNEGDLEPFARLNADPVVMEHIGDLLTREESDAFARTQEQHFTEHGFGLWAVEVTEGASFVGFVGLKLQAFEAAFTPCVEVGWRLLPEHWGKGYATEAARAALDHGFNTVGLHEIHSWTVPMNMRSRSVMERLGFAYDPDDDFDHPRLPEGHPLRRHVRYRLPRELWLEREME